MSTPKGKFILGSREKKHGLQTMEREILLNNQLMDFD
jgi:hypothetical protein